LLEPKAFHAFSRDVSEFKTKNTVVRVIQGEFQKIKAPFELVTKATLLDVTMQPNTILELPAMEMAFVHLITGEVIIADREIAATSLITFESDKVVVKIGNRIANFMFASGAPHNEPIVHDGSFVMTTNEQILETQGRLKRGEMGILNPL
jgi:quercetin 2,3-dioxygenase